MTAEPTLGEVIRRLDTVSREMASLAAELRHDRQETAKIYVRQDVYSRDHHMITGDIEELRTVNEKREDGAIAFRRQMYGGIALLLVGWLGTAVLAVNNYLAAGGATP